MCKKSTMKKQKNIDNQDVNENEDVQNVDNQDVNENEDVQNIDNQDVNEAKDLNINVDIGKPETQNLNNQGINENKPNEQQSKAKEALHPYIMGLNIINKVLAVKLKKDISFNSDEKKEINNLLWEAFPNALTTLNNPKITLTITLASIYAEKTGILDNFLK